MPLDPLAAAFIAVEENKASLTGPQGPQGDQGLKGDTGDRGPVGVDGLDGKDGQDGAEGKPGPKGPKGDKGDRGEPGPEGKRGPAGPAGSGRRGNPGYIARGGGAEGGGGGGSLTVEGDTGSETDVTTLQVEGAGGATVAVTSGGAGVALATITAGGGGGGGGGIDYIQDTDPADPDPVGAGKTWLQTFSTAVDSSVKLHLFVRNLTDDSWLPVGPGDYVVDLTSNAAGHISAWDAVGEVTAADFGVTVANGEGSVFIDTMRLPDGESRGEIALDSGGIDLLVRDDDEDVAARIQLDPAGNVTFTGNSVVVNGNEVIVEGDARLTNARTPTAHATTHHFDGTDPYAAAFVDPLTATPEDIVNALIAAGLMAPA